MRAILTKEEKAKIARGKGLHHTTFDNCTTYSHVKYLAKAHEITKVKKYADAALRGIDFTLSAQYPNGGWPQFYPLEENYSREITFNDDVMVGIMEMLKDIIGNRPQYSFIDSARRQKIKVAYDKGLACILKCQIKDNGKLTSWCQQYDANDLTPAKARMYELPSICNDEGANVTLFLMSIDNPSKEIIKSVQEAVKWYEDSKIVGIRVQEINAPPAKFSSRVKVITTDRIVVNDSGAPPIWARFYKIGTHEPFFSNRKSEILDTMAQVDRERRIGYTWYVYNPQKVLDAYPAWKAKWAAGKD
jgi:PelA/Pel-15E family pectate lyase